MKIKYITENFFDDNDSLDIEQVTKEDALSAYIKNEIPEKIIKLFSSVSGDKKFNFNENDDIKRHKYFPSLYTIDGQRYFHFPVPCLPWNNNKFTYNTDNDKIKVFLLSTSFDKFKIVIVPSYNKSSKLLTVKINWICPQLGKERFVNTALPVLDSIPNVEIYRAKTFIATGDILYHIKDKLEDEVFHDLNFKYIKDIKLEININNETLLEYEDYEDYYDYVMDVTSYSKDDLADAADSLDKYSEYGLTMSPADWEPIGKKDTKFFL